jgi:hypothetical protein
MHHSRWIFALCLLGAGWAGCAREPGRFTPLTTSVPDLSGLDHGAATAEIELMWACAPPGPQGAEVAGVVRNVGPREVHAVGLEAQSVRSGSVAVQETARAQPALSLFGQARTPFRVAVPLKTSGARIDLLFLYAVTPAPWTPNRTEPEQRLLIEDACAPDRHLRVASR